MTPTEELARRIADCLEARLPEYGFEPYRYPSGENKSVDLTREGTVRLYDAEGRSWTLRLERQS